MYLFYVSASITWMLRDCVCVESVAGLSDGSLIVDEGDVWGMKCHGTLRILGWPSPVLWRTPITGVCWLSCFVLGHLLLLEGSSEGSWLLDRESCWPKLSAWFLLEEAGWVWTLDRKGSCFCSGLSLGLFHGRGWCAKLCSENFSYSISCHFWKWL